MDLQDEDVSGTLLPSVTAHTRRFLSAEVHYTFLSRFL